MQIAFTRLANFAAMPSVRIRRGVADELVIEPNDVQIVVDRDAFIDPMKTLGVTFAHACRNKGKNIWTH